MNKKYMIAIPDKKNPNLIKYFYVKGPKFLYGDKIVKEFVEDDNPKVKSNKTNKKERKINKARAEMIQRKSGDKSQKAKNRHNEEEKVVSQNIPEIERHAEEVGVSKTKRNLLEEHIIAEVEKSLEEDEEPLGMPETESAILTDVEESYESVEDEELIVDDSDELDEKLDKKSFAARIAEEIARIMDDEEYEDEGIELQDISDEMITYENDEANGNSKKSISKPKPQEYVSRYTAPKKRGIIARIINRMKYESNWYEDIEMYLDDNYHAYNEIEASRVAEKRRDQWLYKRVQAYEDAEDDITMKRAFLGVKVTAATALLATSFFAVNLLINQVNDIVNNSGYVAQAEVKPSLANANTGQIEYAELALSKISYDFKYLSHTELLDTVIRTASKTSKITENRAMATIKNIGENSDQKLLESILQDAYEGEYDDFSEEKKQELKQLIYEMLDKEIKVWIRSPENVAKLNEKKAAENSETLETEYEK